MCTGVGNLCSIYQSLRSWIEHRIEEVLSVSAPHNMDVTSWIGSDCSHAVVHLSTIDNLHSICDDHLSCFGRWCISAQKGAEHHQQDHQNTLVRLIHFHRLQGTSANKEKRLESPT
uniref:Uncharacterized protein n=1 Tax=uncultured marine group II/III euryarchaeote KM3_185_F09 TaxID=1457950 RepID=A0A075GNN9_9EURY|nr:hypothetical protein [uncultured marine group II/III euryarchaeote KM3_185_F09]